MMYLKIFIFVIIADVFQVLRQVHMLQQNSYNTDSHFIYLKTHLKHFIPNFILLVCSICFLFIKNHNSLILCYALILISIIAIIIFNFPKKMIKPLVFTHRVIRLFVTIFLLNVIAFVPFIVEYFFVDKTNIGNEVIMIIFMFCAIQMLIVHLANIINTPIEKACRGTFIKEAKDILESSPNLEIIGITGSYGKTSTKYFLGEILSEKYECIITPGSFNTPMGVVKTIREKMKATDEVFICEMGARRLGDIKEICDIVHPEHGIITSIGPQHLDTFKNIENVHKTKFELFDSVKGIKLIEEDSLYENEKSESIYTFGLKSSANFYAKNIYTTANGTIFTFVDNLENKATNFHTSLLGYNNVKNLVCAIAFAKLFGMKEDDMLLSVKNIKAVEHRLELKNDGNMIFIDDAYNSNPLGAEEALNVLSLFDDKIKIVITPGMVELGDKTELLNKEFAKKCTEHADYIYFVGNANKQALLDGINETKFDKEKVKCFSNVQGAILEARMLNKNNKVCLLENDLPDNY